MGAEYLSDVKSIATFALTFFWYIISVLASVHRAPQKLPPYETHMARMPPPLQTQPTLLVSL